MNNTQILIGLAASLALNTAVLAGLDWSAHQAQIAPAGIVSVVQLPDPTDLQAYAQTSQTQRTAQL